MGENMRKQSLAVGSGKGGVGKTTTAVNLAIYYAKQGYSTALIDVDPLSNAASLLDIEEEYGETEIREDSSLNDFILPVFDNLDLLFPGSKTGRSDSRLLRKLVFETYEEALNGAYDILIFDMPAGLDAEENLAFLPYIDNLIVVTNPEPTAHVAAGAYIKAALEAAPEITIHLWHNRFTPPKGGGLLQRDVIATYNRNMPQEEHLPESLSSSIKNLAFVPDDPALDLLKGTPSAIMNIHRSLLSVVEQLIETRTEMLTEAAPFNPGIKRLLTQYLTGFQETSAEKFLQDFGAYVSGLLNTAFNIGSMQVRLFTPEEETTLLKIYNTVTSDRKLQHLRRVSLLLERKLAELEDETKLFSPGTRIVQDRDIDRETGLLLRNIQQSADIEPMRSNAAVLLFYFALYKLLQSPTIVGLLNDFIPFRTGSRGEPVRDRREQITQLVQREDAYSRRYFRLIKTLFPVVGRQIETIAKTFGLKNLLFRESGGRRIRSDLYAKLLSSFIHDTLYSGLSVVIGFEYRSAAISFQKGADTLGATILPVKRKSA